MITLSREGFSTIKILVHPFIVVDLQIWKVSLEFVFHQIYHLGRMIIVIIEIFRLHAFQCPKVDVIYMRDDKMSMYDEHCCKSNSIH